MYWRRFSGTGSESAVSRNGGTKNASDYNDEFDGWVTAIRQEARQIEHDDVLET
jgi:hypothetical protein